MNTTEKTLSVYLERATCESCRSNALAAPTNKHGGNIISAMYDCGAVLDISIGHIIVATKTGRTALCIVPRLAE